MPQSRYLFGFLKWYAVLIVLGMALAILLAAREEKRLGLKKDTVIDLALWCIPAGILGARLYYVAFSWESYAANPAAILRIWEGGLAIYGGLIGGALAAAVFARIRRLSLLQLLDIIAPGVALAQAIGRWGNFFNGEAYGLPVLSPALQFFPVSVPVDGSWHMATFFYESLWDLMTFLLLWLTRKRRQHRGDTLLTYLMCYGCGRMVIEGLRMDSLMTAASGERISQLISAGLVLASLLIWTVRRCRCVDKKALVMPVTVSAGCAFGYLLLCPDASFLGYPAAAYVIFAMLMTNCLLSAAEKQYGWLALPAVSMCVQGAVFAAGLSQQALAIALTLTLALAVLCCGGQVMFTHVYHAPKEETLCPPHP
ncbi:MAG: prolipoprotein diacylglyceryl transferase [Clostridia bacterium]|nr:prolipoprotein diacylglyceryl transferase [Clostridia bacterium]